MPDFLSRSRLGPRLKLRRRRAIIDLTGWVVAVAGMAMLDGPVDALPGFACFMLSNVFFVDFWMVATHDTWMVSAERNGLESQREQ